LLVNADYAFNMAVQLYPTNAHARERMFWFQLWCWEHLPKNPGEDQFQDHIRSEIKDNLAAILAERPNFIEQVENTAKTKNLPQVLGQVSNESR